MIQQIVKHRVVLTIALSVAVVVTWFFLLYYPQTGRECALIEERESIIRKLDLASMRLHEARTVTSSLSDIESKWDQLRSSLVQPDSAEAIMKKIRTIASRQNLKLLSVDFNFDPLLDKIGGEDLMLPINRVRLDVEGKGRFFDIGDFIGVLEEEMLVAGIDKLELAYQELINPRIYFSLELEVFILSEEGETN